jgi:hypothetical protein
MKNWRPLRGPKTRRETFRAVGDNPGGVGSKGEEVGDSRRGAEAQRTAKKHKDTHR